MNNHQLIAQNAQMPFDGETVFTNANLIIGDDVVKGSLKLEHGVISDIDTSNSVVGIDCEGDFLCPGLIELHTDNLERHLQPRPGAHWPQQAAILSHDAELSGVGISTVFDALRIGSLPSESGRAHGYKEYARGVATHINDMQANHMLRISHFLHLRAEVCSETLIDEIDGFNAQDHIGIISIMDHTPGQRQFRDKEKFAEYLRGKHSMTDEQIETHFKNLSALQRKNGKMHERAAVEKGRAFGSVLASHDDTTHQDVMESVKTGVGLAEFPTTLEAAQACRDNDILVMMGAPNLLRGGSHSGNVAAQDLFEHDLLDIFSSDYAPSSLLAACVRLGLESGNMANGLAKATSAPAKATNLTDRGVLEIGKRADILRFRVLDQLPITKGLWVAGNRVA